MSNKNTASKGVDSTGGSAISAEIHRVIADEIGGYEAAHPAMQGVTAAVHARVMITLHEQLPSEIARALWERSSLRHGLFTPPQFTVMCANAIRDYLSPNNKVSQCGGNDATDSP